MPLDNPRAEPTLTEVLSGIVSDFHKLMTQQVALLRAEVNQNWHKALGAVRPLLAGGLLAMTGVILLGITLALVLYWALGPAGSDPGRLPLWACFGIASLAFITIGAALVGIGIKQFDEVNAIPRASAEEMEKNVAAVVDARHHPAAT